MAITVDPENCETGALFDLVDLDGRHVLEIGCGDGRLTWRYADKAAHVTAIDPAAKQIALAREHMPDPLQHRIEFQDIGFEEFAAASAPSTFDIVILSWSLC
jgi:2-polyprenyl-3-methyl-5-hydroxy-6-metoxy-1,4-benzoquinol methylase